MDNAVVDNLTTIQFAGPAVKNIYEQTLASTEAGDALEMIKVYFLFMALTDGDRLLSEPEAKRVADLIEQQDRWWIFRGDGHYETKEVVKAMRKSELGDRDVFLAVIPDKPRSLVAYYFLKCPILFTLFQSPRVQDVYYRIATNDKLPLDDINSALSILAETTDTIFPNTTYEPRDFFVEEEVFGPASLNTVAVRMFNTIEYDGVLKEEFEANKTNPTYLKAALKNPNAMLREAAAKQLGDLGQGEDEIITLIKDEKESFEVFCAALEALSKFGNDSAEKILLKNITQGSFLAHLYAGEALVNHFPIQRVVSLLLNMTKSPDIFVRGEGASLFKYLLAREDFNPYQEIAKSHLLAMALNDPEPLVRSLAINSLGYFKDQSLLPRFNGLEQTENVTVKLMTKRAAEMTASKWLIEPPPHRSELLRYYTQFFKYPRQLEWITNAVREKLAQQPEAVSILDIGSSLGLEPLSILMHLVEDYDAKPKAWGKRDPRKFVKIMVTDINLEAILYASRGRFVCTDLPATNEMLGLARYARLRNLNVTGLVNKYFDYSNLLNYWTGDCHFTLKDKYHRMLLFSYLNVGNLTIPLPARPYISVMNNVDMYLSPQERSNAAYGLCNNTDRFVTGFVTYYGAFFLNLFMRIKEQNGKHMFLYEKRAECVPVPHD